jgi:hypothetical protein
VHRRPRCRSPIDVVWSAERKFELSGRPRCPNLLISGNDPNGYRIGQVNSHGENWLSERRSRPAPASGGEQPTAENGRVPGLFRADPRTKRLSAKAGWRRERNSNRTFSFAKSMSYRVHKILVESSGESLMVVFKRCVGDFQAGRLRGRVSTAWYGSSSALVRPVSSGIASFRVTRASPRKLHLRSPRHIADPSGTPARRFAAASRGGSGRR